MKVRPATSADCTAIATIWAPVIRDSAITFSSAEQTEQDIADILQAKAAGGYPFLVAESDGTVCGFATYTQFRNGNGYARAMEHTIILAPEARGRGAGRALMAAIEDHARAAGIHSLWAGVSAANPDGVAFHTALGFRTVATLPEVGWKFGKWYDLVLMGKYL